MSLNRKGLFAAASAFIAWGLLPLYWKLLSEFPAMEVLAHRVLWSFLTLAAFLILSARLTAVLRSSLSLSSVVVLIFSGALISGNWLVYVMAINSGNVLESSLGYFINPLFIVFLGAVVLGERLRAGQYCAIGIAFIGVLLAALSYGRIPYYAVALAGTMGTYALTKKFVSLGSIESLTLEMSCVVAPATLFLLLSDAGTTTEFVDLSYHSLLLASTGVVTAVPLVWFAFAAKQLPMYELGLLQYISPSLQFALAVFVFGEEFDLGRAVAFALIWAAIAVFLMEGAMHRSRRVRPLSREFLRISRERGRTLRDLRLGHHLL